MPETQFADLEEQAAGPPEGWCSVARAEQGVRTSYCRPEFLVRLCCMGAVQLAAPSPPQQRTIESGMGQVGLGTCGNVNTHKP